MRALTRLMTVVALGLGGCQDPAAPGVWNPAMSAETLTIADLALDSRHLVGAERFGLSLNVSAAGTGTLTHYGLKTRLGEKLYALKPPLAVVNGGRVRMVVGPLPDASQAGPLPLEFWLVDSAGRESNRLAGEVFIQ